MYESNVVHRIGWLRIALLSTLEVIFGIVQLCSRMNPLHATEKLFSDEPKQIANYNIDMYDIFIALHQNEELKFQP